MAIDFLGINGRELSHRLHLSPSAVGKRAQRGRRDPETEKRAKAFFREPE